MTERVNHVYRLVTVPRLYSLFQNLLGGNSARRRLVKEHYDISAGSRVLDLGCGPGDFLGVLPDVEYTGVDLNPKHIEAAKYRWGTRGTFVHDDVASLSLQSHDAFDRIIFTGLLHHLDDSAATALVQTCGTLLAPRGRMIGLEPCYVDGQHPFARWMKNRDSGQNIRDLQGYRKLFVGSEGTLETILLDDLLRIPYNHVVISWSK